MNKKLKYPQKRKSNIYSLSPGCFKLLFIYLLIRSTDTKVTEYTFDFNRLKTDLDVNLGAISSISSLATTTKYNYFIFFQDKSGTTKATRIEIEHNSISFVDVQGVQISPQSVSLARKVSESISGYDSTNRAVNQEALTIDRSSNSIDLYSSSSLATCSAPTLKSLTSVHDIALATKMVSSNAGVLFFHALINNKLAQIKVLLSGGCSADLNYHSTTVGVQINSVSGFTGGGCKDNWGVVGVNNVNEGKIYLVALESTLFIASDFAEIKVQGSSLRCDVVGRHTLNDWKFFCGENNQKLKIFEVDAFGVNPASAIHHPAPKAVTFKIYYRIETPPTPASTSYTEILVALVLGEKVNGDRGISICKVSTAEEMDFYKIEGSWGADEVTISTLKSIIVFKKSTDFANPENDPPFIKYINLEEISGVEDCKTNKETGNFLSKKCGECVEGKYADPEPNGPDGACVSTCTKGIKDNTQRLCFSSAECNLQNCLTCVNASPTKCATCVENYKVQGGVCVNKCKTQESYQIGTGICFDCLSVNHCQDCIDFNKECNSCQVGYELKGLEKVVCEKICPNPNFYYNDPNCIDCLTENSCKVCDYSTGFCNECKENHYRDLNDQKKCLPCISADVKCIECETSSGCTKCQPGYKVVGGKCQLKCPGASSSWNENLGKCVDCTLNNCSKCDELTQECQECNGDQFQLDQKNNKICSLKYPEDHRSWSSKEAKCVDCTLNNCSKCDELTQECQECKDGFKIDPLDKKKCLEIIKGKIQFSHKFSKIESLSDLTLRLTLSHKNGTEINYKIPFNNTNEKSRMEIFNITGESTSEILPSYTSYDSEGNLFTYVNLTSTFKDKADIELNFEVFNQKINNDITLEKTKKNLKVKIPKEKVEVNSFTSTITDSTHPNEGLSTSAVVLDPTGMLAKAAQYIKMINRFTFLNIDFGEKLSSILEASAKVNKIPPKNRILTGDDYLLSKDGNKGKFDVYRVSLKFEGNLAIKTIGYLSSWSFVLIEFFILRKIRKEKKLVEV